MKTYIKICGIQKQKDAIAAIKAGADYIGFIFVPSSPRCISVKKAQKILSSVKQPIKTVGVFQNQPVEYVSKIAKELHLDYIQLHGDESPSYCRELSFPIIKAFTLESNFDADTLLNQMATYDIAYFLLDRKKGGKRLDAKPISNIATRYNIFVAGGLNNKNVSEIIKKTHPYGVDVVSGVQKDSHIDPQKMTSFISSVHNSSMFFDYKTKYDADAKGHFGIYGGRYAPEMLIPALEELEAVYLSAKKDPTFEKEFFYHLKHFVGRPSPLYFAENLTKKIGGAKIYLKNEGLNHTGAHKINHCVGQALLAKRLGKKRLIAETGAGQHGVATATVAAKFGFECTVYMGEEDIKRQRPNVFLMQQLGAKVVPVTYGSRTLKDAVNAALKDWISTVQDSHYVLGSTLGPHPFPSINRDFQSIVGYEVKEQINEMEGRLPDYLVACVGGGSNAMGLFYRFLEDPSVSLIGVEAGGRGTKKIGDHASRFSGGRVGVIEGYKSIFLQDNDGNIVQTHSISAGLDYPGIGPQFAYLRDKKRVSFAVATDDEALEAMQILSRSEGIIPALESAHAVAHGLNIASTLSPDKIIVINISGRGDKDIFITAEALKDQDFFTFLKEKVSQYTYET